MMKKLLVFLCFLFLVPAACAQDTGAYTPGTTTQGLFVQALEQGDMLLADFGGDITFNEGAVELLGEDLALLHALSEAMRNTTVTIGGGQIEDGVRFLLGGKYAAQDQEVAFDATLDLTSDGVRVMSSLIPGEALTIGWDTLMTYAGVTAEDLVPLQAVSEEDMETALIELAEQLAPMIEIGTQIAAPYIETVLAHIQALPIEVLENVPAEGDYPAAATEINVTISAKAIGDLLIALADQLEADATLCAIFDAMLAESGEELTTVELCAAVRESAMESMTDESSPLVIFLGMNEADEFLYLHISQESTDSDSVYFSLITQPFSEDPSKQLISLSLLATDAEETSVDGFSLALTWPQEETADVLLDTQGLLELYEESETALVFQFLLNEANTTTQDGQPGRLGAYLLSFAVADDDTVSTISLNMDSMQCKTADGEESSLSGALNISEGDTTLPFTFQVRSQASAAEDGPTILHASTVQAPDLGIDDSLLGYMLYTDASKIDLSTVTELSLETATPEALNALAERAQLSLEDTVAKLAELLPAEIAELLL